MSTLTANKKIGLIRSMFDQGGINYKGDGVERLHDDETIQFVLGVTIFSYTVDGYSFAGVLKAVTDSVKRYPVGHKQGRRRLCGAIQF